MAGKIGNSECISVKKNGKYIFIDENGKQIVPGTYDFARCFRDGLAAVYKDGKAGYIDATGKLVIPYIFEEATSAYNSCAWVRYNGLWGVCKIKN